MERAFRSLTWNAKGGLWFSGFYEIEKLAALRGKRQPKLPHCKTRGQVAARVEVALAYSFIPSAKDLLALVR
jgi:hypothetical protein